MDKETFLREIGRADAFKRLDPDRADYWTGYQRGLQRAYHGESYGTPEEHALWLGANDNYGDNPIWRLRAEGYRDGLNGTPAHAPKHSNEEAF